MMNRHNNYIRLIILCALCITGLFGCASTLDTLEKPVHTLFEEKGWNRSDSKNIKRALEDTNLFGQISLAALLKKGDKDPKNAFTEPSPCIFNGSPDPSNLSGKWNKFVDEMEKENIIGKGIDSGAPLNSEQRKEALELLKNGDIGEDLEESFVGIFKVLDRAESGSVKDLADDLSNAQFAKEIFSAIKTDEQLRIKDVFGRKHLFVNTAKVVNSSAIGSIVSDTVKVFINKDNKTMRLAIIAYARMNGINITKQNLDDLGTALSQDNPDFYPLLAGLMDTMKKEYGYNDLTEAIDKIKRRDQECRPSAA